MAIVLFRTLIVYSVLLLGMRAMGKRQLGELELSELVVSVLVADLASFPLQDTGIPLINGLVSILTLFCLELILSGLVLRFGRLRTALYGKPCFLVEKGVIDQAEMRRSRYSLDELAEELRRQGVTDLTTVEYAILETDGSLNVILSPAAQPVTAGQMGLSPEPVGYPYVLISDGRILTDNLQKCGRDEDWLRAQCRTRGAADPSDVFLFSCTESGTIYFAGKEAAG